GPIFITMGLILFAKSLDLFIKIGNGTLAPWHPTKNIVVKGLYRFVRNPMIIGVNLILTGEAFIFRSGNLLIFMFFFVALNHFYFVFKEEPDLVKRFGEEYQEYCRQVPRWIPRLKGWRPEERSEI
ncbi:MAG: methyltransferase family protein, partial [Cyclobacteriaceae bacterium]